MITGFSLEKWESYSYQELLSLTFCRAVRDSIASELCKVFGDREGLSDKEFLEIYCLCPSPDRALEDYKNYINDIVCWDLPEVKRNRLLSFFQSGYYFDQTQLLYIISKHVAPLERERVKQPIIVPA